MIVFVLLVCSTLLPSTISSFPEISSFVRLHFLLMTVPFLYLLSSQQYFNVKYFANVSALIDNTSYHFCNVMFYAVPELMKYLLFCPVNYIERF